MPVANRYSVLIALAVVVYIAVIWRRSSRFRQIPLPPGPPMTSWISGHASILPLKKSWKVYTEWAHIYGPLLHLRAYNQRLIVLSSIEDCIEIYEKRSSNYSDRPTLPIADLMGWDFNAGIMSYGPRWRRQRRLFHQFFRKVKCLAYRPDQTRKVNDMLYGLLTSPEDFRNHVQTLSAAVVMSVTYGYDVQPKKDHFVEIAEEAAVRLATAAVPGAALVNHIPILRYIPPWFPGAGFHKMSAETKKLTTQMKEIPLKWTQEKLKAGIPVDCIVAAKLPSCKTQEDIVTLQEFATMIYAAGADTTTGVMNTFFYVMAAVAPDAQRKAQEEIDRVVGGDRLPTYDDWDSLRFTQAILRECLRWRPLLPLGFAHRAMDNDIYKGYLIPKGSFVMANTWALTRDPKVYKDPETFNPDRFFDSDGNLNDDDLNYTFGFGRRKCPGLHLVNATVFLSMATTLWAFDIGKAKDASGKEIPIPENYSDGLISHVQPHACSITPRSSRVEQIIKESVSQTKE